MALVALRSLLAADPADRPATMRALLAGITPLLPMLDLISNATIFIKDEHARYVLANRELVKRCGLKTLAPLLNKTSEEVFPARFGAGYTAQDRRVLDQGVALAGQLELHLYGCREPGWCLTHKQPLFDHENRIIGLAGISLDLLAARDAHPAYQRLAQVDHHIRENFHRAIPMQELTRIAAVSVAQLERYCKRIFQMTPRQMILKARLEHACRLLHSDMPITEIALRCGYSDHSAFTRQFKTLTGFSPRQFRSISGVAIEKGSALNAGMTPP